MSQVWRISRLASKDYTRAIAGLREVVQFHPDLIDAQALLAKYLLLVCGKEPQAMTECLRLLRAVMEKQPENVEALTDYMTLLQQAQMARAALGTHPEGSLRNQILAAGLRGLSLSRKSVEVLRIISVQYRYSKEFAMGRRFIVEALCQLLVGLQNLAATISGAPRSEESAVATAAEALTPEQLRFRASNFLELLGISEAVAARLPPAQLTNLRRWVSFCRSDLGFINLHEARHLMETSGEGLQEGSVAYKLLAMATEDFQVATDIYPNSSAVFGQAEAADTWGKPEECLQLLRESYALQPTYTVRDALRVRGIEPEGSS